MDSATQPGGWRAWGLAAALLVASLLLRMLLDPLLGERYPFGTVYLLVGIVGWFLGVAPAVAAAIAGFFAGNLLFVEPRGMLFGGGEKDWVEFGFFVAICAGGILLTRRVHQREDSLRCALLEQTATRDALHRSEHRFREVLDSMSDIVFTLNPDGSREYVNPRWQEFTGRSDADATHFESLVPVDELAALHAARRHALATGEPVRSEFRMRDRDGRLRWFVSRTVPIRDARGVLTGWVGTVTDIDATRRAREELELVTGLMTTGVVQGSRDHRFVWANRAYLSWINRGIDELRGLPIAAVVGEAGFERLRPHLERVLAGESFDYEEPIDLPRAGRRWIHAAYTPVLGRDGVADGWVAVVNDVTHRHGLEDELRDASRRKDEFIATLAHELRNPLAPIRYATQLFRPGVSAAQMADARRMIDRQLAHMSRLLDDLLDVSRVTRGALELRRDVIDLRTLIETAVEAAQSLAAAAGHGIDLRLPAEPLPVDGDATRLVQVIGNLLSNAVRFTPAGGRICVEAAAEAHKAAGGVAGGDEPDEIVVTVCDNGIGIDDELLPRIFEPFVQGERSSGPSGGLGIGLSLARHLALLHGGSLTASSAGAGRGSEFTLRLPRAASAPAAVGALAEPDRVSALGAHARRLLVVDDNVDAADSLAQMLRLAGFETRVAYDGRTALEIAELMHPDVALLDLGLPLLSGYDVARRLRGETWGRDLRLIAVTGWGQEGDRARSRDAGFDEHLTKPVDPEVLIEAILHETTPAPSASVAGG